MKTVKAATTKFREFRSDNHLPTKKTGLPFVVWISPRGSARHDVRVGVALGPKAGKSEVVSVAIRPDVRVVKGTMGGSELACLRRWVDLNRQVIVKFWDGVIRSHKDAVAAIRRVRCKVVKKAAESSADEGEVAVFEWTNLDSMLTNLPFYVWVQPSMGARHGARVGVSRNWNVGRADMVSVAILPDVRVVRGKLSSSDLALLRRWVNLNRDVIVKYWNSEEIVYSADVFGAVKPLPGKGRAFQCIAPEDDDGALFEFTELYPELTGLPFYVWVQPSMGARHGVRVGVSYDNRNIGRRDLVSVAIRPDVRVVRGKLNNRNLALLRQWVSLNRDMIVKYWNNGTETMDSLDVYNAVRSLPSRGKRKTNEIEHTDDLKPAPG